MTWVRWNLVSVRLETVFVWVQDRCMVCTKHAIGSETFWTHQWYFKVMRLKWKLDLVYLKIVLILTQDK